MTTTDAEKSRGCRVEVDAGNKITGRLWVPAILGAKTSDGRFQVRYGGSTYRMAARDIRPCAS